MQLSAQGVVHITTNFTYIVAHTLYTYARKPVESKSIYFVLRVGKPFGLNPTSKQGIYFHFLTEWWRTHSNVLA